jgi:hypothetical protein
VLAFLVLVCHQKKNRSHTRNAERISKKTKKYSYFVFFKLLYRFIFAYSKKELFAIIPDCIRFINRTQKAGGKNMYNFEIEKCTFDGVAGAMIVQKKNGRPVLSQFVSADCLADFCRAIGRNDLYTEYIKQSN